MRLARSLALWLSGTTAVVLGSYGLLQHQQEQRELHQTARRELKLVTTSVRLAVENALRDNQSPDVSVLLRQLAVLDPDLHVYVFDSWGRPVFTSSTGESEVTLARQLAEKFKSGDPLRLEELPVERELAAVSPVKVGGARIGRLILLKPTDAMQEELRQQRDRILVAIFGLIIATAVVISIVVHLRLHRPMKDLVRGIRRVASGDLGARIDSSSTDEIAELGAEFDKMTAELERAGDELAREIAHRQHMENEMQRANRLMVVGELAAALAHEIGSPLQVLNGRARALAARGDLAQDAERSAQILVEQTDRVTSIVEQLLDVARRREPQFAPLDVTEPVRAVCELLAPQARKLGVRIVARLGDVPAVDADAAQVQQVLLNLLQNALRASPSGADVVVDVRHGVEELVAGRGKSGVVILSVADRGPGIPESLRERLFEPFVSGWGEREGGTGTGTGLGLAVTKSIVRAHQGTIGVREGIEGMGSTFFVHLPLREGGGCSTSRHQEAKQAEAVG